jgi:hypothetical protein
VACTERHTGCDLCAMDEGVNMGPVSQQIALMVMVCGVLAFVLGKCVGA